LPAGGQITVDFNYLLQTQGSTTGDLAQLQIKPTAGSTWTTLASYNGVAESNVWRAATPVDVSAYAGQTVQLRFNFASNDVSNNFEGWYVDDLLIRQTLPHDNYSFTAPGGQNVTVALEALTPGSINVLLQNAAGTSTLATGAAGAANVDRMIYNFGPLAAGTYNLAVVGATNTDYSLVVTQGAVFDRELNDTAAAAQPFSPPPVALGSIGTKETVTIDAIDAGWYDSTGFHDPTNTNYVTGYCCEPADHRNFFVFDLAGVSRSIASAELRVLTPSGGFASNAGSETYQLFDISTSVATLRAGGAGKTAIYNDLGSGVSYASRVVTPADDGQVLSLPLSAAAVANLNTSLGSLAALGGGLTTISGTADQVVFGYSGLNAGAVQLVVTLADTADYYSFNASVGQTIHLFTATPGAAPAQPGNNLNPHLRLIGPNGTVVATGISTDGQGNEDISYPVLAGGAGTYKVEVTAEGGTSGDYILDPEISSAVPTLLPLASGGELKVKKATSLAKAPALVALPPASVDRVLTASLNGNARTALQPQPRTNVEALLDALVSPPRRPVGLAAWLRSRS
jgi:hypothetical protein